MFNKKNYVKLNVSGSMTSVSNTSLVKNSNIQYRKWNTVPTRVITSNNLMNMLPFTLRFFNRVILLDKRYWITDIDSYQKIAMEAISLDHNYVIDRFDCDDFSAVLYCYSRYEYGINGIGRVIDFISHHSYNIAVTSDGRVYVIEPQNANVFTLNSRSKRFYSLMFALITF